MKYAIIIHKANGNYSAHAPDVDGCIATGKTIEETRQNMKEALAFHFEGMAEDGDPIPEPTTAADYVEVDVPVQTKPAVPRPRARKKVPARR